MGARPSGGGEKFLLRWLKFAQIRFVLSGHAIRHRIELEMNLVEAAGEVNAENRPEGSAFESTDKALNPGPGGPPRPRAA